MLHIYHPNKAVKGFACSFWYSERDSAIYATLVKQSGWDERSQNGTFKDSLKDPTKKVNIKLSFIEAGGILDCIERNRPFSQYHDSEAAPKQISFTPWVGKAWTKADGTEMPATQNGFSFSITVLDKQDTTAKNPFFIGLSYAEARYIREFLLFCMHKNFKAFKSSPPQAFSSEAVPSNNASAPAVKDELTGM